MVYVPSASLSSVGVAREYCVRVSGGRTVTRKFCPVCGAPVLLSASVWPNIVGVWAGSLDDPSWFKPQAASWVSSAQPWDILSPVVRQFHQGPDLEFLVQCQMPAGQA